jgi:hypothetical protein
MNKWMNDYNYGSNSSASIRCAMRNERFTSLSLELEFESGPEFDEEDDKEEKKLYLHLLSIYLIEVV